MATSSVDLLSVIPGIQVSASDILQAELLLSQVLSAQDPTLDLRTGTAVRDLGVRPAATLLATINKALTYYWTQNSLSNVDDLTPTIFVDKILQNFFMTRFTGTKTTIMARLYFAKSTTVSIGTDIFFSTDNKIRFFPVAAATYSAANMTFDSSLNQFYISVPLVAENAGSSYNIASGSLIYFSNFNPFFLHAEIGYVTSVSTDPETNLQFVSRARNSISTRNLVNSPSIKSNLMDAFPIISEVKSVGMGDIEMIRDKAKISPPMLGSDIWAGLGGMVDIYTRVPISTSILQFTTDAFGRIELTGPIFKVAMSTTSGGALVDQIPTYASFSTSNKFLTVETPTSVVGSGTQVLVILLNHGLVAGERIKVAGVTNVVAFNGVFKIDAIVDKDSFLYSMPGGSNTTAVGAITISHVNRSMEVGFSSNQNMVVDFAEAPKAISSISDSLGTVTVVCSAHGFHTGDTVTLSGLPTTAYNDSFVVTAISADTFSFAALPGYSITAVTGLAANIRANQVVSIEISFFQGVDGIQNYLRDPVNKILATDQLVRGFNICMLDIGIVGYGASSPDRAIATKVIDTYLNSLAPGQTFIMADLVSSMSKSGISTIRTPLSITYTKYYRDLFSPEYGTIQDAFNPSESTNVFLLNSLSTSVVTI